MGLFYNGNKFQYAVLQRSLPFGEVRRGSSFNAFNCMKAYSFNGERYGYYGYDASGKRTYKYGLDRIDITTNQGDVYVTETYWEANEMMFYPNGYINMNQNGEYTKHYYADALRIASKIGNGFSQNLCDEANQIGNLYPDYLDDRMNKQQGEMIEELTELINGNQITSINPIPYPEADLCNLSGSGIETALFFYHPDHLGSTGMVTNNSSNITQGMLYAPFGEIISDYNPTFHDSPMPNYAFNAKELDEENNMYYYSARYYAPPTFISRDPMFEKYPSISPYTYCKNNPLNRVDPTGEEDYKNNDWVKGTNGKIVYDSRVKSKSDAEKYYGKKADALSIGYTYKSKQGEVRLGDNGEYTLNGKTHKVKDQATGISKVISAVKNFDASLAGSSDGANSGRSSSDMENKIIDAVSPVAQGLALLNPLVGSFNGVYTAIAGEDIYENEASTAGRIISGVGVVAGGVGTIASGVVSSVAKRIEKAIDVWTVIQTTREGYNKKNKK